MFKPVRDLDSVALNILNKRYFWPGESSWADITDRVIRSISKAQGEERQLLYELLLNRYFIPNSPTLVNAGKRGGGLSACFVVPFEDSIEDIYKTKLAFALIAKKGGGCGTTLSRIRPKGSPVAGSTHGYAGGPVDFYDTICHDMEVITQAGFREMAMMGTMSVYHPDILYFITAKRQEGKMRTTNISVVVDDAFMRKVENNEEYETVFNGKVYNRYNARDVFNMIVDGAWRNGEPGILFYERLNNSPYKYTGQEILATNPCGEQPLPFWGTCNLGSLDLSKFVNQHNEFDFQLFEVAIRLAVRFLDDVIDANSYPLPEIEEWTLRNRPIGLGIMGLADYFLIKGIEYGSDRSLQEVELIMSFMKSIAEDESFILGEERGIPEECSKLPEPRRNITVLSIAPTGTISLLAGCSSGIEPVFSEVVLRTDKTGTYEIRHPYADSPHFKCAVRSYPETREVTVEEHILIQNAVQKFVDSGVSKTINFPNDATRKDVYKAFIEAWKLPYIKGLTIYRSGSRQQEVLKPQKQPNQLYKTCPICGAPMIKFDGCEKCSECDYSVCTVG